MNKPALFFLISILFTCTHKEDSFIRDNPLDSGGMNWNPPEVTLMSNTSININDTLKVKAVAEDNGEITAYIWARNGIIFSDTTDTGMLHVTYTKSGRSVIRVKVLDDDGLVSRVDSCVVSVTLDAPVLEPASDTAVNINITKSVEITVVASDTNATGKIKRYYWDTGADGWDDSTKSSKYTVKTEGTGIVTVWWGARDDDGIFSFDTFTVDFVNRKPGQPRLTAPKDYLGWVNYNWINNKGTLPLTMSAYDPDSLEDTLTFSLLTGTQADTLFDVYTGTDTIFNLRNVGLSERVYYRLIVRDVCGDSAVSSGSFLSPDSSLPPEGMVYITGGTFLMGSLDGEDNEKPVHRVTLSDFLMGATEVTEQQFTDLMLSTYGTPEYYHDPCFTYMFGASGVEDPIPASDVSWYEAVLYCNALTKANGSSDTVYSYSSPLLEDITVDLSKNGYRLPTEAQWEYACHAGTTSEYFWEGEGKVGDYAWYQANSSYNCKDADLNPYDCAFRLNDVGTKEPNAFGLYDMIGSVLEWCNDWYGMYEYGEQTDPQGPESGVYKVTRGGHFMSLCSSNWGCELRSSNRYTGYHFYRDSPLCPLVDDYSVQGLRVVLPAQ